MVRITPITHRITRFALALCLCVAVLLPALPMSIVRAAGTTYYVGQLFPDDTGANTANCAIATNTDCTLRDALAVATSGTDTIQFYANIGVYTLTNGPLVLANSLTITGPGPNRVAIDGGRNAGTGSAGTIVFRVNDYVTATISGLEITHGNNQGVGGGGIYNSGSLTLTNDLIDHNNTTDIGGGVDSPGGLAAITSLTVMGCTITGNTSGSSGGGIYGGTNTVSITNSTITNNRGGQGGGGLFLATTTSTITGSTISGNTATGYAGGGIYSFSGTLTITGSTIANNTADAPGGGGIRDTATGPLTITDSTVSGNTATGTASGGGILEQGIALTLTRVQLTGNNAGGDGGGVSATTTTPVTVTGGTVGSNTAGGNGGGIFATTATTINATFSSNGAGNLGGGLWIGGATTAKLTDSGSAFTGNTAPSLFGGGGGLYFQQGTLALTGDSFGGNNAGSATAQGFGGGVFMANGSGTITGATFTGNSVMFDGCGGALEANAGTLAIANSLFSGNFGTQGQPCGGAIAVEGASVSVTNSAFTGNSITATTTPGGGGAVAVDSGTLTVTGSSFINNKVTNPPPNALNTVPKGGGAIELNGGTTTVTNSTFAGNVALGDAHTGGGAVVVDGTRAIAALNNLTFSGNSAPTGGAVWVPVGTGTLTDVIAVGSTNGTAMNRPTLDLAGTFVAASRNNLIGAADGTATGITNGGNGNQVGSLVAPLNARLGPLADNGGGALPGGAHPLSFALLPSSPAIDAGGVCGTNPATNQPLAVDQRGIARPQGNGCDIGAYEYVPVQPTITGSYRVGTSGQAITLTGTGFQRGSVVSVGGVTLPASAVTNLADNGTSLTVTLPMHAAGVVTLVVTNPGNLTSVATGNLTYVTPNATPAPATAVPTVASKPNIAPPLHPTATPPATPLPTPLPQPARH